MSKSRFLRILIIDDDKFIRNQLASLFTTDNSAVLIFKTAEDALDTITNNGADFVLTDIYLDGMTGLELISLLKDKGNKTPVIAMTGDDSIELERQVRSLGVYAYFVKPLETHLLAKTVREAFL